MTRLLFKENVLEKARQRVKLAFDDFPHIVCTFSGGKDSLAVLALALEEAEKRERKIALAFLDQEAEWDSTIKEVKRWMSHPLIVPYWCRVPFILENSTGILSDQSHYLVTYDPAKQSDWIHPYDSLAFYQFPKYITSKFDKMRIGKKDSGMEMCNGKRYPGFYLALDALIHSACEHKRTAVFGGIRACEALGRVRMCSHKFYRNMNGTYPATNAFYRGPTCSEDTIMHINPIYDWRFSDVWKYIYDKNLPYNILYDRLFQLGLPHPQMRVSSVCHEMSLAWISILPEIEPDCWDRVQKRLSGTNTYKQSGISCTCPDQFPSMFRSWADYRDYLFENLIPEENKPALAKVLARANSYMGTALEIPAVKCQITCILICDLVGVRMEKFIDTYR